MDIRCTQSIYPSASGNASISYYIFRPIGVELRGVVQISHGMCEYFTRYTQFAKYLCSLGFVVCGNDHLGHGSSVPPTGSYGFFGHKDGWSILVDDLSTLTLRMKKRWPHLPYFLFGQCMGANLLRIYLQRYGALVDGCILSGVPAIPSGTLLRVQLANSVIRYRGPMFRSVMLNKLLMGNYNCRIADCHSPFDWLCRDHNVVNLYQSDSKCNFIFTAAGFRDLFYLSYACNRPSCLRETPTGVPLLLLAGDADPVCHYGSSVKKLAAAYKAAGCRDVDVVFYKDDRHELLNELNRTEVYGDIGRWLEKHLPAPTIAAQQS